MLLQENVYWRIKLANYFRLYTCCLTDYSNIVFVLLLISVHIIVVLSTSFVIIVCTSNDFHKISCTSGFSHFVISPLVCDLTLLL